MNDPCSRCPHAIHMHPQGGHCRAVSVTGPAAFDGKQVGPLFDHGSRLVTPCDCEGFKGRNGVAL